MNDSRIDDGVAFRRRLPLFVAAPADQVPVGILRIPGMTEGDRQSLVALALDAAGCDITDSELRKIVTAALTILDAHPVALTRGGDVDSHDEYFRIERTEADRDLTYLRSVLLAAHLFLDESHDCGSTADYACMGDALVEQWCDALGVVMPIHRLQMPQVPGENSVREVRAPATTPMLRWVRGHHIFAVLTQGLIRAFHSFDAAMVGPESAATLAVIRRLGRLYLASAEAFRFAADFDAVYYTEIIRPSMCEPYVPKGFSGTLSVDHRSLVQVLAEQKEQLGVARARYPAEYAVMAQALAQVYEDHKWVCDRFEGGFKPSLRTSSANGSQLAVDMIDRFKERRLDMLGRCPHAQNA